MASVYDTRIHRNYDAPPLPPAMDCRADSLAAIKSKTTGQCLAYVYARETRCRKGDGAASVGC